MEFLKVQQIPVPDMHSGHGEHDHGIRSFAGCPGTASRSIPRASQQSSSQTGIPTESELRQWPVQLRLLNPQASYFNNADIQVAADCVPFAYAEFHQELLKGKILIIFCPKLDVDPEEYIEKIDAIFGSHTIHSVTSVHMEVPCCSGTTHVVNQAMKQSKSSIPVKEVTISIDGNVI